MFGHLIRQVRPSQAMVFSLRAHLPPSPTGEGFKLAARIVYKNTVLFLTIDI